MLWDNPICNFVIVDLLIDQFVKIMNVEESGQTMNIAILIPTLEGGGAERMSQILGNYFISQGHCVYYFLLNINTKQDYSVQGEIIKTNIESCMSGETNDAQQMLQLFRSSLQMRKLKYQYKIDVAISFMEECNYINVLSRGREKVITRVCTILSQRKDLVGFLYKKEVVRFFYSMADQVVVMSNFALKDMHHYYGVPRRKLIKIPNMVTGSNMEEKEREWEYGTKAIVCMGRLETVKQQDRIIRAFTYVVGKEEQARLILLGKGHNLRYLQGLCVRNQIENKVRFIGFTDQTTHYLKHARAFVMASQVEGFPNSMIEAMSCGVPIITTDTPGACGEIVGKPKDIDRISKMIFCKYGILTPNMSTERLKPDCHLSTQEIILGDAMLLLLTDTEVYEKYRNQSFKRAKMFQLDRIVEKWNKIVGS